MQGFLESPRNIGRPPTPKNASLIDILNTPSKLSKQKSSATSKPETDSSHSSTTVDDACEVSFEHQRLKKLINQNAIKTGKESRSVFTITIPIQREVQDWDMQELRTVEILQIRKQLLFRTWRNGTENKIRFKRVLQDEDLQTFRTLRFLSIWPTLPVFSLPE